MNESPIANRRLVRTPDGKVAGVCAGLGHYLGLDPTIVRLAFIAATLLGGSGVLIYGAGWLVMPKGEPGQASAGAAPVKAPSATIAGIIGLVIGAGLVAGGHPFGGHLNGVVAIALIAGGIALLWQQPDRGGAPGEASPPSFVPPGPSTTAPTGWGMGPTSAGEPPVSQSSPLLTSSAPLVWQSSAAAPPRSEDAGGTWPGASTPRWSDEPRSALFEPPPEPAWRPPGTSGPAAALPVTSRHAPPRRALPFGLAALSLLAVGGGAALAAEGAGAEVTWPAALAGGLIIVGLVAIVAALWGRARGLVALGLALMVSLLAVSTTAPWARGGIGDELERPFALAELQPTYELTIGALQVDLRSMPFPAGTTTEVQVRVGVGEGKVVVPADVVVVFEGHVGLGEIRGVDGRADDGADRTVRQRLEPTVRPSGSTEPATVVVHLRVGVGEGRLERG